MARQVLAGTNGLAATAAGPQVSGNWQSQQAQPNYIERFADIDAARYTGGLQIQESATLRYTASQEPYAVPPLRFGGRIKLAIVVTMYAESPKDLNGTLESIAQNITNFVKRRTAGERDGLDWGEILVVIVSDGRQKLPRETLAYLEEHALVSEQLIVLAEEEGIMDPQRVLMHSFESSFQMEVSDAHVGSFGRRYKPMQLVFALKAHNAGKLDSHKWFFDAYCRPAQPDFVVLIDAGTRPAELAIVALYNCMRCNSNIGGCCGEIAADLGDTAWQQLGTMWTNWVVAAQHFEYKMSHCMDKPLESWFGFVTVLPGAFSAYRYRALVGEPDCLEPPPLQKYFASLPDPNRRGGRAAREQDAFDANMYLAEDRILCFEIVAMKGKKYTLHYQKGAVAYTDVPEALNDLLKQRRRWLNGSFFAMLHALMNFSKIFTDSTHGWARKAMFALQLVYFVFSVVITWFLPGSFFLGFSLVLETTFQGAAWSTATYFLTLVFSLTTALVFLLSLATNAVYTRHAFRMCSIAYGVLLALSTFVALFHVGEQSPFVVVLFTGSVFTAFIVCSVVHGHVFHIAASLIQYYALLPTFLMIFTIYSFCNIHDVSWGTKGLDTVQTHAPMQRERSNVALQDMTQGQRDALVAQRKAEEASRRELIKQAEEKETKRKNEFQWFRAKVVALMICANWVFVTMIRNFVLPNHVHVYTKTLAAVVSIMLGIRVFGCFAYQIERIVKVTCGRVYVQKQIEQAEQSLLPNA